MVMHNLASCVIVKGLPRHSSRCRAMPKSQLPLRHVALAAVCALLAGVGGCTEAKDEAQRQPSPTEVEEPAQPTTAEPQVESDDNAFPQFGFALQPPTGWAAEPAVQPVHFAARWLPEDVSDDDISQFTVNVTPARTDSFEVLVRNTNVPEGFQSSRIKLDGVAALELRNPKMGLLIEGSRPPIGPIVICLHKGLEYKLAFLLDSRKEIVAARQVINSWKWLPVESSFNKLELGPPTDIIGGKARMCLPMSARRDLSLVSETTDSYIIFDYRGRQDAIVMAAEWNEATGNSLEQQAIAYAEQVERRTRLNAFLSFQRLEETPHVRISQSVIGEFPGDNGPVKRMSWYAVWEVGPGQFVHVQFVVNDEMIRSDDDRRAAQAAIVATLKSCEADNATAASDSPPS